MSSSEGEEERTTVQEQLANADLMNDDEDEEYKPEKKTKKRNKVVVDDDDNMSSSASPSSDEEDEDEGDDAPLAPKPKSERIKTQQSVDNGIQESKPQTRLELELEKQKGSELDAAINAAKKSKKRVELTLAEKKELVRKTLEEMSTAYAKDVYNRREKRPAMEKLKHLDSVLTNLNNMALAHTFVDDGVAMQLTNWLKPSRHHLANLRIRTELLKVCDRLPLLNEPTTLEASLLGKMINYYATHEDSFENRILATRILERWVNHLKSG